MVKNKLHTIRKNTDSNCTVSIKDVTFTIILRAVASRPSITPVALTYSYINIIYNTILFTTIVILHNRTARPSSTMLPEISLICLWTLGYDNPVGRSPLGWESAGVAAVVVCGGGGGRVTSLRGGGRGGGGRVRGVRGVRGARAGRLASLARQERLAARQQREARVYGVALAAHAELVPRSGQKPLLVSTCPAYFRPAPPANDIIVLLPLLSSSVL